MTDKVPVTGLTASDNSVTYGYGNLLMAGAGGTVTVSGSLLNITSAGTVGINTTFTAGDRTLDVNGPFIARGLITASTSTAGAGFTYIDLIDSDGAVRTNIVSGFSSTSSTLEFGTSIDGTRAERMRIHTNGNVGIGMTSPSSKLFVQGDIRATDNITAYFSSDRTLKTNIVKISNALNKVNSLRGVEFDWTDEYIKKNGGEDNYFMRKHDVGVIAQEVEAVLPEVVATREDGIKAVKYDRIVALLIEAVKDLSNQIKELKDSK
jgi:hypothetical protein